MRRSEAEAAGAVALAPEEAAVEAVALIPPSQMCL